MSRLGEDKYSLTHYSLSRVERVYACFKHNLPDGWSDRGDLSYSGLSVTGQTTQSAPYLALQWPSNHPSSSYVFSPLFLIRYSKKWGRNLRQIMGKIHPRPVEMR